MSHANRFDLRRPTAGRCTSRGRGGDAARSVSVAPLVAPFLSRAEATLIWADLVARRCRSREAAADQFKVTFQTACNWFDGFSCPTGDKVMLALRWWPEEFVGGAA